MTVKTGAQMRLTGKEYSGKEGRAGRSKQRVAQEIAQREERMRGNKKESFRTARLSADGGGGNVSA